MRVKLGDILTINPRESIPRGTVARKIAMENLRPFQRDVFECSYEKYKGGTKFRNRDTILARITPCLENGKTAFINCLNENELAFGSTEYYVLRPKEEILDPYYLFYLVTSKKFRSVAIKGMAGTSGRQRVPKEIVKSYELDLPSIEEQRRISSILRILDDKQTINNRVNANLAELAQSVYQRILSTFPTTEVKLNSFATITMGQSPSSKTYNENKIGMPLLNGAADFRDGIHPSKWTTDPKRIAKKGSYIFGVRATIGLTTKIFHPYAIGRGTGTATPKDINNDEILYFVLNDMFKKFEQTGSGSVYINISKKDFQNYTFNIPDTKGLLLFHKNVQPIMDQVYKRKQENETLQKIKDCLLNKLF